MIYLDHAATTPVDDRVLQKMLPFFKEDFGNPSSIYQFGQKSRVAIDDARKKTAKILNCKPLEIYFTGSGTESNNWALFGIAEANQDLRIITTKIEHDSILNPAKELQRRGHEVIFLDVDSNGHIKLKELDSLLKTEEKLNDLNKGINSNSNQASKKTTLVSVMYANNEIGTIEDIAKIGALAHAHSALMHTDACQAAGALELDIKKLNVDLMTLNGGKIYGPKGVGALYISEEVKITPLIYGGGQEHRIRAGTENVPAIVGFAEALEIAEEMREIESTRLAILRDYLIAELSKIPGSHLNGDPKNRLPNNINFSFEGVDGESLLLRLDLEGICASSGSACTSGSLEPSHVLLGIGQNEAMAKSSLRLTLGRHTTKEELIKAGNIIKEVVQELR